MAEHPVWAIDVGETSIKAVKMRLRGGHPEILEVDRVEYERNLLDEESDEEDRNMIIRQALIDLGKRRRMSGYTIVTAIPGRLTISKTVELPPTEKAKIPEMVRFEVQNVIPFPIEEIIWDYVVIDGSGTAGSKIEVNLLATKKESVYSFLSNFQAARINVDILQTAPLALYNMVKVDQFPDENVVVVDIGAVNTDLVIINEQRYWVRNVPKAGHRLTVAMQQKFEVTFEEAERLKIEATTPAQIKQVSEAVRPVLRDLVGEISRTIGFYKSQAKEANFDRILFLGNTIRVAGFKKFMSGSLPYKVDYFSGLRTVRVSKRINLEAFKANLPSFGITIGLGLQGVGVAPNRVNLMPREKEESRQRVARRVTMAAAVVFLAVGMWLLNEVAIKGRSKVAGDTKDYVQRVSKVLGKADLWKEIRSAELETAGLMEPCRDRAIPERASAAVIGLIDSYNRKRAGTGLKFGMFLSEMAFNVKTEEKTKGPAPTGPRAAPTSAFEKKITVTIRLAVAGADARESRKTVEDNVLSGLGDMDITNRLAGGAAVVRLTTTDPLNSTPIFHPLLPDPLKPVGREETSGSYRADTGFYVWEIYWELVSEVKTKADIESSQMGGGR